MLGVVKGGGVEVVYCGECWGLLRVGSVGGC